ncbi:MAG: ribosomal large subunit pseudouridine synthase B, partial [Paludibacteraceae bacterium]|nr:ribosomal large subunit pseudouridine synthase B [Paludibacteraceae bacterium]
MEKKTNNRPPLKSGARPKARPARPAAKAKPQSESDGTIRLNRCLANAGVCSRREADVFIEAGVVKVNGQVV